ncbi:MAG: hypothetical protein ACPKQO_08595 [Nitrososphaeraceae archaeon]
MFEDRTKKYLKDEIDARNQLNYNGIDKSLSLSSALNKIGLNKLLNYNSGDFNNIEYNNPMIREIINQHKNNLRRIHDPGLKKITTESDSNEFDIVNKVTKKSLDFMNQSVKKDNDRNINDHIKNKKNNIHEFKEYNFG